MSNPARMLRRAGIDRAIGFTVLGRGWTAAAGLVTLMLMTRFLSPIQQGYYFTFNSVLGLSVLFELGLSTVLVQFAGHEWAALEWTPTGTLEGDPSARARLASLLQKSLKWYAAAGFLLTAVVLPAGMIFFSRHGNPGIPWQLPWTWIVLVTGLTVALTPALAVLEGCGLIAQIARLQMWQNIAGSLLLWLALIAHGGLYTVPVTNTVILICQVVWISTQKKAFLTDLLRHRGHKAQIDWRGEIWPLQWKIGLSYLSGYFIFQLFNPILFATHGPVAAGQMGLSLTVMLTIGTIGLAWVTTKAATFGTLVARKDYAELDRRFFPSLWQSWALVAVGSAALWGAAFALHLAHFAVANRILNPWPLGLLAAATTINHGVSAEAIYLRAHKQEPFLALSLVIALCVTLSGLLLGRPYGAMGMMLGYFFVSLLGLAVGTRLFLTKRRQWHEIT